MQTKLQNAKDSNQIQDNDSKQTETNLATIANTKEMKIIHRWIKQLSYTKDGRKENWYATGQWCM